MLKVLVLLGLIGFIWLAIAIAPAPGATSVVPEQHQPTKDETATMRAAAGLSTIMSGVRNPDSFVLESARHMADGSDCYIFRSQNGFGGMTREFGVLLPTNQIRIATMDGDGYVDTYNKHCGSNKSGVKLPASSLTSLAKFVAAH